MRNFRHSLSINFLRLLANILQFFGFEIPPVVAVCGIVEKGNKILAIDLSYKKGLALPGGGMIREESLEEGLKREVKEETGCEIKSMEYYDSFALKRDNLVGLVVCFKVRLDKKNRLKSSDEGEPIWVTPEYFLKYASYKPNEYFVKKLFAN